MKLKVAQSCLTLCDPIDISPWNSSGQNTGMGSLSLLQGIFPTQGSDPGLPHCRQILYQLSHKRAIFFHNSGGWKSKIKVLAKLISGMTSLLGLQTLFTVLAHGLFSVCAPGVHSASYKDINVVRLGPRFWPHFTFNYSLQSPYIQTQSWWETGLDVLLSS